jgi:hypothetical protein
MLELQETETLRGLEEVRFVVMSEIDQPVFTFYRDLLPGVQRYLERHFRVAREFRGKRAGWIIVLERAEDRGPAAIDLIARRDLARSWIRDGAGVVSPAMVAPRLATMQNRRPLPIALGAKGGGVDYEIEVPADAVFQAAVGLAKIRGRNRPHPTHVEFSVSVGRDGDFDRLATIPAQRHSDDGSSWRPFEIDLAKYAGERIDLRIEVKPTFPLGDRRIAWLGSPRIATPSRPSRSEPSDSLD